MDYVFKMDKPYTTSPMYLSMEERDAIYKKAEDKLMALLNELGEDEDYDREGPHIRADGILCELLYDLGADKVIDLYKSVEKWYA